MDQFKLTYFDMRGRAEAIRLLFALADVPYDDIRVSQEGFPQMKPKLPYGELPVLEFGDTILSQSAAIGRFLSRKFGYHGKTEVEAAKIDEITDACFDYALVYWKGWYGNEETKAAAVKEFLEIATPKYLKKFSQILEENGGEFLVGKSLTWADIVLFNSIQFYGMLTNADLIKDYPVVQSFVKKIGEIPKIKEWIEKRPVTSM